MKDKVWVAEVRSTNLRVGVHTFFAAVVIFISFGRAAFIA